MNDDRFDPMSGSQQAQALKKAVSEKGGASNFNSIAVSGYKVDWKQIGLSPVELDIIESEKFQDFAYFTYFLYFHIFLILSHIFMKYAMQSPVLIVNAMQSPLHIY